MRSSKSARKTCVHNQVPWLRKELLKLAPGTELRTARDFMRLLKQIEDEDIRNVNSELERLLIKFDAIQVRKRVLEAKMFGFLK